VGRVQFYGGNRLHGEGMVLVQRALWSGKGKGGGGVGGKYKCGPDGRNGDGLMSNLNGQSVDLGKSRAGSGHGRFGGGVGRGQSSGLGRSGLGRGGGYSKTGGFGDFKLGESFLESEIKKKFEKLRKPLTFTRYNDNDRKRGMLSGRTQTASHRRYVSMDTDKNRNNFLAIAGCPTSTRNPPNLEYNNYCFSCEGGSTTDIHHNQGFIPDKHENLPYLNISEIDIPPNYHNSHPKAPTPIIQKNS
jgi:hypothetical protein